LSLPNATDSTTLLILFAKAALPGQVKTRLIVALGAQGACDLYEKMMRLQIERFQHFPQCDFVLHITPDKNSPYSNCLKQDYHLEIEQQQGNDLGERMYFSISETLKKYRKVVLFGADLTVGSEMDVSIFAEGQKVDVSGTSIGKGFQGGIKRHHFHRQDMTHGNSVSHRSNGSIGQNQSPGRVFKGKKMSGHLGAAKRTIQNIDVVRVDAENNLLLVKGGIPGAKGSDVVVSSAVKVN